MGSAAFPDTAGIPNNPAHLGTVVARWLRGETFPITTASLVNLIRALGATADDTDELIALHEEVRRQDGRYGKLFRRQPAAHHTAPPSPSIIVPPSPSVRYGTVKWFNSEKGFGFLAQDQGGPDVFIHYSEIKTPGFRYMEEGERVQYQVRQGSKGPIAVEIEPLDRTAP
jgi:CspA family cold shock protein